MKTFRFIGMAIVAILMSVNFVACSSDDENEPEKDETGIVVKEKKLVKIVEKGDGRYEDEIFEFTYDNQGRVLSVMNGPTSTIIFTWGDNTVTVTEDFWTTTYNISNGLITSGREIDNGGDITEYTFSYDSSKRLIEYVQDWDEYDNSIYNYIWDNQKLIRFKDEDYYTGTYEYTSNNTCKGYRPYHRDEVMKRWTMENSELFWVHPELIGLRDTNLPDRIKEEHYDGEGTVTFTYTKDEEGYVTKCTAIEKQGNYSTTLTWEYTWE